MDFLILGPVEVRDGVHVVSLQRRKHRALLAILAVRANSVVSTDVLLEELWGGNLPRTARQALHNYVSLLRKELGADVVETHDEGYVLRIPDDDLDARRFERLVASAGSAPDAETRHAILAEALALWRGPALADFAYEPFAEHEARRLDELRLNAREELIDAGLALGRHEALVPELEQLVRDHPYRERLSSQLMLALYRSGRQVDALDAYRAARQALIELGLEPSEALRTLEQAILRQDPGLELLEREARRKTVTVVVCELVLDPSGLDPEHLRVRLSRAMTEARAAVELLGGSVELLAGDELLAVFDSAQHAVQAATEIRDAGDFAVGVATGGVLAGRGFVSGEVVFVAKKLARAAASGELLLDTTTQMQVEALDDAATRRLEPPSPLIGRARELALLRSAYARAPQVLTVVGEQGIGKTRLARELAVVVHDEATVLVGRCSPSGEGATLLPLREMLLQAGLALEAVVDPATTIGEQLLEVRRAFDGLSAERPVLLVLDDAHWAEPALLDFVEQLGAKATGPVLVVCLAWPGSRTVGEVVELGSLSDDAVGLMVGGRSELVEAAAGNPLFAEQLLAYAQREGQTAALPASLEALIAARLDLLEAGERSVLRRAAVIGQMFSHAALQDLGRVDEPISPALLALAEKRFVRRLRGGWRFHHPLVRDAMYAALPKEERAELHERYADWLDERDEPEELIGYHLEQAFRYRLELKPKDPGGRRLATDAGLRLGSAGTNAWKRGDAGAAANLLGRAATALPADDRRRIDLLCELGPALRACGDLVAAAATLEQAIAAATMLADRRLELRARLELAVLQLVTEPGRADALETADAAIPVFQAVVDHRSLGRAWLAAAAVSGAFHNRYAIAASAAERAVEHYTLAGWPTPACLAVLAAALYHGPMPAGEAIERCRELSAGADLLGRAHAVVNIAGLEAIRGALAEARRLAETARKTFEELGHAEAVETDWRPIAINIELLAGDRTSAERGLRASCAALERTGDRAYLATRAAQLANLLAETARIDEAETWATLALELGASDDIHTQVWWRRARTAILLLRGALDEAEALIRDAVALTAATDHLDNRAQVLLVQSRVLHALGRTGDATEATGQAVALFEQKENVVAAERARAGTARLRTS
jgi:DNA-binding SARP family transcriptional activator